MSFFTLKGSSEKRLRGVPGGKLKCLVCGGDQFNERTAQLNTAGSQFFGVAWSNPTGTCYVCVACGYIHWFLE